MSGPGTLGIGHHRRDDVTVVTPAGVLDTASYPRLRDTLLKFLAEQPIAVVVDLSGLEVPDEVVLSVFPTVAMVSVTPPVPLLLAAAGAQLGPLLDAGGVTRFVPTYPTVSAAVDAATSKPMRRCRLLDLLCSPSTSQAARLWVRERCAEWALPDGDPLETVTLVASELVDNMIRHARTDGRLRLEQHRSGLTVAVSDRSPRPPVLRAREAGQPAGGLAVVDALATTWSHRPIGFDGKVVWAVLPFPTARPGDAPPPRWVSTVELQDGVARAALEPDDLWLRYVGLGGSLSAKGLAAALSGEVVLPADHDYVARALNEFFDETGDDYSVPYDPA